MRMYILLIALAAVATPSVASGTDPVAEANFRKAIEAAGGEGRFNTIKAPTMWMKTVTYHGSGDAVPFVSQYASYWPKRWYRRLIEGRFAMGVAGDQVTMFRDGGTNRSKLSGPYLERALQLTHVAWAQLLYPLLEDDYTLSNIPGVDVEGKPTVGVKALHQSGSAILLYFDKTTFLLKKTQAKVAAIDPRGQLVTSETFFSDHKSFGGVMLPSKYKTLYDGKLFVEGETIAIKVHATIDPAWFGVEGPARVR